MSTFAATTTTAASLNGATTVGHVALTVSDPARSSAFYENVLGLQASRSDDGVILLGGTGRSALVTLHGQADARPLDRRATGLFHLALLLPSRLDLAYALSRLARTRWPLDGASDHLVSEALYLSDPDGHGIEIYRDRERSEWTYDANGQLAMSTLRLDLQNLAGELEGAPPPPVTVPAGTSIGHVHLQVSDLDEAEAFYGGVLGFDVVVRGYPGALFVSAGGYHHHIGLNTWNSAGSGPPAPGSIGLRSFDVLLPDQGELQRVLERVQAAGLKVEPAAGGASSIVRDPSGNAVVLSAA